MPTYTSYHIQGYAEIIDPATGEGHLVKLDKDVRREDKPLLVDRVDPHRVGFDPAAIDPTLKAFYDQKVKHD